MIPPFPGGVGGIKDSHTNTIFFHKFSEIGQGRVARLFSFCHEFFVMMVEKLGGAFRPIKLATIITHIEYLRLDVEEESEVPYNAIGYMRLSRC